MDIIETVSMTQKDTVIQGLRRVTIVDVGYIIEYDASTNHAKVQAAGEQKSTSRTYSNVEVLFAGCMRNGLQGAVEGSACLLFVPQSSAPDLASFTISNNQKEYTTYKCLPVFTPDTDVPVGFSIQEDGSILFDTDKYNLAINEDCVILASDDGKAQEYWSPSYKKSIMKGGTTTWVDMLKATGEREICQYQGSTVLNKISISAAGEVSIDATKGITVTGDLTVTGNFSAANGNLTAEV